MQIDYPYKPMASYPHMGQKEAVLWTRFIVHYENYFDRVWYDVAIGRPSPNAAHPEANYDKMGRYLSRPKCDVIGWKNNQPTIIEVKPYAGFGAVGQIDAYRDIYVECEDANADPDCIILTDYVREHMVKLCKDRGISLIVV